MTTADPQEKSTQEIQDAIEHRRRLNLWSPPAVREIAERIRRDVFPNHPGFVVSSGFRIYLEGPTFTHYRPAIERAIAATGHKGARYLEAAPDGLDEGVVVRIDYAEPMEDGLTPMRQALDDRRGLIVPAAIEEAAELIRRDLFPTCPDVVRPSGGRIYFVEPVFADVPGKVLNVLEPHWGVDRFLGMQHVRQDGTLLFRLDFTDHADRLRAAVGAQTCGVVRYAVRSAPGGKYEFFEDVNLAIEAADERNRASVLALDFRQDPDELQDGLPYCLRLHDVRVEYPES